PSLLSLFGDEVPSNFFHRQFIGYTIFWSFVLMSAVNVNGFIKALFTLPVLRFYGMISFSLYLWHRSFIVLINKVGLDGFFGAWSVLLSATLLSYVTFKYVELPPSKFKLSDWLAKVRRKNNA
ncbi:MAG: hypothetical protein AAGB19_23335, partial [Cyanobacteria bacterium P01_F01_bin.3]